MPKPWRLCSMPKVLEHKFAIGPDEYSGQITDSAGALLLTEEALESAQGSLLLDVLKAQPPWSELPLIILTSGGESRRARLLNLAAAAAGTVTLLERPISALTLLRSVQVALCSRRRQYQVRDLVTQLASLKESLEQRVRERTAELSTANRQLEKEIERRKGLGGRNSRDQRSRTTAPRPGITRWALPASYRSGIHGSFGRDAIEESSGHRCESISKKSPNS